MRISIITVCIALLSAGHLQALPYPAVVDIENAKAGDLATRTGLLGDYKADFGTLLVAENRSKENPKLIQLPVVRVHSRSDSPAVPIFCFEGGPGGTNIKSESLPDWLLENHDYVMVGHRGVDGSVSLDCPEIKNTMKTVNALLSTEGLKACGKAMTEAAQRLQREGIDLAEYDIINVVDDMEDARKALGYEKINISGGSYGGAICYIYCVRYPQSIHRNLMTEGAFPFNMGLAEPQGIDAKLNRQNELWKQNPANVAKSDDIVRTIQNVLKTLPKEWNGAMIDPGRIKLVTFFSLYTKDATTQAFDAFVAAENGDYNGLAFLNTIWDSVVDMFNWGDLLAKTYCTKTGPDRDYESEMDPPDSIIGSPLSKLGWGMSKYVDWPIKPLPPEYQTLQYNDVETLMIYGSKEAGKGPKANQLPYFKNGQIVIHEDMGHMDVGTVQQEASRHLEKMFFLKGVVDTSKFQ
ncbi:alpha/beta fold hydrolase [Candidatus Poribacteria bacterium]